MERPDHSPLTPHGEEMLRAMNQAAGANFMAQDAQLGKPERARDAIERRIKRHHAAIRDLQELSDALPKEIPLGADFAIQRLLAAIDRAG